MFSPGTQRFLCEVQSYIDTLSVGKLLFLFLSHVPHGFTYRTESSRAE